MAPKLTTLLGVSLSVLFSWLLSTVIESLERKAIDGGRRVSTDRVSRLTFADHYIPIPKRSNFEQKKVFHAILHTHTDAGWVETMAVYERLFVTNIFNSSTEYFKSHLDGKDKLLISNYDFIKSFIEKFPQYKEEFIKASNSGQFQIVGGGVIMPDQACTYYDDLINNYEYGREYGLKIMGNVTNVSWAIDTFGHSAFHTRLCAEMGYEALFLVRTHNDLKMKLKEQLSMNNIWRHNYDEYSIFNHVEGQHYNTPMQFEAGCCANLIITSHEFDEYFRKTYQCVSRIEESYEFRENDIFVLFGDDFAYSNFSKYLKSDKNILRMIRSNTKSLFKNLEFKQSTVEEYLQAIKNANITYPSLPAKDIFPVTKVYEFGSMYWSGFFFSRPHLKKSIRDVSHMILGGSHILAAAYLKAGKLPADFERKYERLEDVRFLKAILSHHDAITGTCTRHVADDYFNMMYSATSIFNYDLASTLLPVLGLKVEEAELELRWHIAPFQNYTIGTQSFVLDSTPSPIPDDSHLSSSVYMIFNQHLAGWKEISATLLRGLKPLPTHGAIHLTSVCDLPFHCLHRYRLWLDSFETVTLDTAAVASGETAEVEKQNTKVRELREEKALELTPTITVTFSKSHLVFTIPHQVHIGLHAYEEGRLGSLNKILYEVGMYTFMTFTPAYSVPAQRATVTEHASGTFTVTMYGSELAYSLSVFVDPSSPTQILTSRLSLPQLKYKYNRDYMLRFYFPDINNGRSFRTESNGFDLIDREYDTHRKPEASFYPVTKFIQIQDDKLVATVMSDRAQGGSSLSPGLIEIGVARVNLVRDGLGVIEHLEEDYWTVIEHKIIVAEKGSQIHRIMQLEQDSAPVYGILKFKDQGLKNIYLEKTNKIRKEKELKRLQDSASRKIKPEDQYIRSLLDLAKDSIKIRLYNLHEYQSFKIDNVKEFIKQRYGIERDIEIEERSLDYNLPITTILNQPYMWRNVSALHKAYSEETVGEGIILKPLKMRTYKIFI
jgi:ASC-1-like (ASCH) protein